jgi:hypothetical protein
MTSTQPKIWYKEEPKVEHTFIATILEINGTSVTVQPVENSAILMSSDKVSFGTANLEKIDVEVGSVVKVIYTGGVMESYPAKVNAKSWSLSDDLRHMEYNEQWLDTATFDIDGDGKEEQCTFTERMSTAAENLSSQVGRASEQFSQSLSSEQETVRAFTKRSIWISLIPTAALIIWELIRHTFLLT